MDIFQADREVCYRKDLLMSFSIEVDGVSKKFARNLRSSLVYGIRDVLSFGRSVEDDLRTNEFWAIKDVSFSVKEGEALGIVGSNGSGKTTLLRIIYGIIEANRGRVKTTGRIAALLAANSGFHPHLTGRENVFLICSILGLHPKRIKEIYPRISEFADIGPFMDAPVSTYSSGMAVRLAFSISVHSEPQILIADEALAVGDLAFTLKCYRKIAEYQKNGGTLLFVSHSMQTMKNTCNRVMWLEKGLVKQNGPANEVCDSFEKYMLDNAQLTLGTGAVVNHDTLTRLTGVRVFQNGLSVDEISGEEQVEFRISYDFNREVKFPILTFAILTVENIVAISSYSNEILTSPLVMKGKGEIGILFKNLRIKPGIYFLTLTLAEQTLTNVLDWHEKTYTIRVKKPQNVPMSDGLIQNIPRWIN